MRWNAILIAAAALALAGCTSTPYQQRPAARSNANLAKLELAKDKVARLKAEREAKEAAAKAEADAAREAYVAENADRPPKILEAIKASKLAIGMTQAEAALVVTAASKTAELTEKGIRTTWTLAGGPTVDHLGADLAVGPVKAIEFWKGKLFKVITGS